MLLLIPAIPITVCACGVQKPIDLSDGIASAIASLLLLMRGPGAVGTTALECRRLAPATFHNIQEVCRDQLAQPVCDRVLSPLQRKAAPARRPDRDHKTVCVVLLNCYITKCSVGKLLHHNSPGTRSLNLACMSHHSVTASDFPFCNLVRGQTQHMEASV